MEMVKYPSNWMRVEVHVDRAVVVRKRVPGDEEPFPNQLWDRLGQRLIRDVQRVLDLSAMRDRRADGGFVPEVFVYHVSGSGDYVFDYTGMLCWCHRNKLAGETMAANARRAADASRPQGIGVHTWEFPIVRRDGNVELGPAAPAATTEPRDFAHRAVAGTRPLFDNVTISERTRAVAPTVDDLTPMQCYDAFCAAQQDQRTFVVALPVQLLRAGDLVAIDVDSPECVVKAAVISNERIENGWKRKLTLRAEGRDFERAEKSGSEFLVRRSTVLTQAQRTVAREIWSRGLRYQVAVTDARAAAQAPSVAIADVELEIEALAADVP